MSYLSPHLVVDLANRSGPASDPTAHHGLGEPSPWVCAGRTWSEPAARCSTWPAAAAATCAGWPRTASPSPRSTATPDALAAAACAGHGVRGRHRGRPLAAAGRALRRRGRHQLPVAAAVAQPAAGAGAGRRADLRDLRQGNETVGKPSRADFLLQPGELLAGCAGPARGRLRRRLSRPRRSASCSASPLCTKRAGRLPPRHPLGDADPEDRAG